MATQDIPTTIDPTTLPAPYNTAAAAAILYISARITIHAPIESAFRVLADPENFHHWNTFAEKAEVVKPTSSDCTKPADRDSRAPPDPNSEALALTKLRPGDTVILHVRMKPSDSSLRKTPVVVQSVSNYPPTGRELCTARAAEVSRDMGVEGGKKTMRVVWGAQSWGLKVARVMEVREADEAGTCEFRTWESMEGMLARVVNLLYKGVLQERFFGWARELGERVEELEGDEGKTGTGGK